MKNTLLALFVLSFSLTSLACADHQKISDPGFGITSSANYPDEWWKPVPESDLASWEIGPQAADRSKNEVILSKRNDLGMLSNFYAAPFDLEGLHFASVEGLWQSLKYPENANDPRNDPSVTWPFTRSQVEMMTAFEAKDAGEIASSNMSKLKIKWVSFKGQKIEYKGKDQKKHYELIFRATAQKVLQNPEVKNLLLKTGDLNLLPDHKQEANSPPAYEYFKIAMKIRSALQKGEQPKP